VSQRDPAPLLQAAIPLFQNSRQIAIIGPPKCGKTVVAALLYDAIVNKFIPTFKNYRIQVNDGLDFLQKTLLTLKKGEFPVKTPDNDVNKVDMILKQEVGTGGSIEIKLNDLAGEVYEDFYLQDLPRNERLYLTLKRVKGEKSFSDTTFLIFCKIYTILVDSEDFQNWNKISFDNVRLLNAILQWKQAINTAPNGKITAPIAIIFTKTDLLDENIRNKSGEDLIKEFMPEFYQQLHSIVEPDPGFFKVHLEVKRNESNESDVSSGGNFTVETPIKYSADEYVNFISWIDNNMK
jgi:hypothetical protein